MVTALIFATVVARATTVLPPTFDELVNNADYIVHARTKSVTATKATSGHGPKIYTQVELEIVDVVAGTPPAQVTLRLLGGQVGDERMIVEGMPRFRVGDEDVLFVSGNGHAVCPLYGMMHGRFPVRTDPASGRKYMTRENGAPLENTRQIFTPMTASPSVGAAAREAAVSGALGLTDFIRKIRSQVKPDARLNRAK